MTDDLYDEPEQKEFDEMPAPEEDAKMPRQQFRPPSAKNLSLKELTGKEERVAVIGEIVSIDKPEMSGKISSEGIECMITFTEGEQVLGLSTGSIVRVIGKPSKEKGLELEADIVQELKGFDSNLYNKVKELEKAHLRE